MTPNPTIRITRSKTQKDWTYTHTTSKDGQTLELGFPDTPEGCRRAGAWAIILANKYRATQVELALSQKHGKEVSEGVQHGSYSFDMFKQQETTVEDIFFVQGREEDIDLGMLYGDATNFARDLINTPANILTPEALAKEAAAIPGVKATIRNKKWLEQQNMHLVLGVAQGSALKPVFIELAYGPAKDHIALVGKGVTYDTGGLSIKLKGMEWMKADMGGAAAVLATMRAVAELKLPIGVRGYIPCVENAVGANAQRVSDVVVGHAGISVEIMNTDAEGRLILADALSYASTKKPACIVDLATLTGACIVALGHEASAVIGDDTLSSELIAAGHAAGDICWPLPQLEEIDQLLKSSVADVRNIAANSSIAGTVQGAMFLRRFVQDVPWAHIDIAGTAFRSTPPKIQPHWQREGANGGGVRLLIEWLRNR